ncbi:putative MFS transporter [Mycena rebaudengoi]|nr:putative MFS transporter [Mycena rebaudengoi]
MPSSVASNEKSAKSSSIKDESPGVPIDEGRLLLKLDWRILPIVILLYLLSFLDRTNIGNAKITGLPEDLHLVGLQYNVCAAVFFVSYCFFEVPSNMILQQLLWLLSKFTPTLLLPVSSSAFAEAGLLPGATFYLSQWYPHHHYGRRIGPFMSAFTMAGAFGGILAFAIQHMDG